MHQLVIALPARLIQLTAAALGTRRPTDLTRQIQESRREVNRVRAALTSSQLKLALIGRKLEHYASLEETATELATGGCLETARSLMHHACQMREHLEARRRILSYEFHSLKVELRYHDYQITRMLHPRTS